MCSRVNWALLLLVLPLAGALAVAVLPAATLAGATITHGGATPAALSSVVSASVSVSKAVSASFSASNSWSLVPPQLAGVGASASNSVVSATGVTLSGRVLDPSGNGIPNQTVGLAPAGSSDWTTTTTTSTGAYSFQVAPGNYSVQVNAYNNNPSVNAPQWYDLTPDSSSTLSLTQNTTMDISLPIKRVSVHVQDANGNPQSGVVLSVGGSWSYNLPIGTLTGMGYNSYSKTAPTPLTTNAAGDASLWLFPTPGAPYNTSYAITATPPAWSPWATTSATGVLVTADRSLTITLASPVTLSGRVVDPSVEPPIFWTLG